MADFVDIVTEMPSVLQLLASNLTTIELFHLALTSKDLWQAIGASAPVFSTLKALTLCDGSGVAARKSRDEALTGASRNRNPDVLYNAAALQCLKDDNVACVKCEKRVCNECRHHIRYRQDYHQPLMTLPPKAYPVARYHDQLWPDQLILFQPDTLTWRVRHLCKNCKASGLQRLSDAGNGSCDCVPSPIGRWVCRRCANDEIQADMAFKKGRKSITQQNKILDPRDTRGYHIDRVIVGYVSYTPGETLPLLEQGIESLG
ncbi:MAG: hypothetical protein M1827_004001 [Pycnora praestabilis]|nr:MAG: hypothetical protein M1827_004001 [Pycnora praestabilis]